MAWHVRPCGLRLGPCWSTFETHEADGWSVEAMYVVSTAVAAEAVYSHGGTPVWAPNARQLRLTPRILGQSSLPCSLMVYGWQKQIVREDMCRLAGNHESDRSRSSGWQLWMKLLRKV